jgi:hypothetical protein
MKAATASNILVRRFIGWANVVYPHLIVDESDSPTVFCGFSGVARGKRASRIETKVFCECADGSEKVAGGQSLGAADPMPDPIPGIIFLPARPGGATMSRPDALTGLPRRFDRFETPRFTLFAPAFQKKGPLTPLFAGMDPFRAGPPLLFSTPMVQQGASSPLFAPSFRNFARKFQ